MVLAAWFRLGEPMARSQPFFRFFKCMAGRKPLVSSNLKAL
jgi:hypothetical protein